MKRVKRTVVAVVAVAVIVLVALTFTNYAPAYLVRVDGQSMEPTLHNGDYLLAVRGQAEPGRIIIARRGEGDRCLQRPISQGGYGRRVRAILLRGT